MTVQNIILSISGILIPIILFAYTYSAKRIQKYQLHVENEVKYQEYLNILNTLCKKNELENKATVERLERVSLKIFAYTRPQLKTLVKYFKEVEKGKRIDLKFILDETERLKNLNNFVIKNN